MNSSIRILLDTEYISIKGSKEGVIFRVAILVYDSINEVELEAHDLWCNYNLFKLYPNTAQWSSQLKWLNSNPKYNAGYEIRARYKSGMDLRQIRHLLYLLVGKYKCRNLYCKGITPTDCLLTRLPLQEIDAPLYEEIHEPLEELRFYNTFIKKIK